MGPEKKIFEVNKDCKLTRNLLDIFKKDSNSEYLKNMVIQLFEVAQLSDGDLADIHSLAKRLSSYFEESSSWYIAK
jgi:HSP90 family molecular chaperone